MEEERKWIDVILSTSNIYNYVQKRTNESDKKRKRVMDYLDMLKSYNTRCIRNRGSRFERLYKNIFFYRKFVIRKEDIPDSYFENLINEAKKEGRKLSFTEEEKKEKIIGLINDQKKTLDEWINYFLYGNGRFYEMYKQFWAFQGLQKLGVFDKKTYTFRKKNKNTVNPIPPLNEAALEKTIYLMERYIKNGEVVDEIKKGFTSYNFKALYEYSLKDVMKKRENTTKEGIWKRYEKGSDYSILMDDIRGKYTGWCTERESWAKDYLSKSDFDIYYTKDVYGEFTDPRLAIRSIDNNIVEVRGIEKGQDVEFVMTDILHDKLKQFEFSEEYFEKELNIKILTLIYKKDRKNIQLTKEELEFLYQINDVVSGFGSGIDPRIKAIISSRNIKQDLSIIFNVKEEEVAYDIDSLNEKTKVFYGNLDYYNNGSLKVSCNDEEYDIDNVYIPDYIIGSMHLNVPSDKLIMPKLVTENFGVFCPRRMNKLTLPKVGIHLSVYKIEDAIEIIIPSHHIYDIRFYDLCNCGRIILPDNIKGVVDFRNLMTASEIHFPKKMKRSILLPKLYSCDSLILPEMLGEDLIMPNVEDAELPKKVNGILKCNIKERSVIR